MLSKLGYLLYLSTSIQAIAIPSKDHVFKRDGDNITTFSLPPATNSKARAAAIEVKRQNFLYGPSIAGNTSFYPAGPLGEAMVAQDNADFFAFQTEVATNATADATEALAAITAAGGLQTLDSYKILYDGQWKRTGPAGPYPGMLSNYTNDLLFSMERLTVNPYVLQRLDPGTALPFTVDDSIVKNLTTASLSTLLAQGRLFLVDHSDQKDLPKQADKFGAACQAYFYINPKSGDFLPLAIKPNNEGSDLVYTPADAPTDWLFAKILFNINDIWHGQWYHLSGTHELVDIVYESAIRSLSDEHPIMAILKRCAFQTFAFRQAAIQLLILSGGPVDQLFPWAGSIAGNYTDNLYHSGVASAFQANYFEKNLAKRGLINSRNGPALKSFPFYEDGSVIMSQIRAFITVFVNSYYTSSDSIKGDVELQNWIKEAIPAQIIDFPSSCNDKTTLVELLSHIVHLVTIAHATLNTNTPIASSASLPFHPLGLYKEIPTAKGIVDIMEWMPKEAKSLRQITLLAAFNRPQFANTEKSLSHLFDIADFTQKMNAKVAAAAGVFKQTMLDFSKIVRARKFDTNGLSQGMPFIWNALDPELAPFFMAI